MKIYWLSDSQMIGIGQSIAGISATVFGAILAALAIVTALMDKPLLINMRQTGHWLRLVNNTLFTACAMLSSAIISVISMLAVGEHQRIFLSVSVAIVVAGFGLLLKTGYRYRQVMKHL